MILFDWDDAKDARNRREHGIAFDDASLVFDDPHRLTMEDSVVQGELRWRTIGIAFGIAVVLVIYLEGDFRGDVYVRIISARGLPPPKGATMTRNVRRTSEDPVSPESIERLKRLAEMPDELINTSDIPDRRFNVTHTPARSKSSWSSENIPQRKAS